jgi:hypothetical protein
VSGGHLNLASGTDSSVSAGERNTAGGDGSWIGAGIHNTVASTASDAAILGGPGNIAVLSDQKIP